MSIIVDHISKSFADRNKKNHRKLVLENVCFEVPEGEFVSLLGPSGCGKSTTLTIIAGFQEMDSGRVIVNGNVVRKPGPDRAFVFQDYALLPWMKVGENICYPMKMQGVPKAEREELETAVRKAAEAAYAWAYEPLDRVMSQYNIKVKKKTGDDEGTEKD